MPSCLLEVYDSRWEFWVLVDLNDDLQKPLVWSVFCMPVSKYSPYLRAYPYCLLQIWTKVLIIRKKIIGVALRAVKWLVYICRLVCKMHIFWSVKNTPVTWPIQNCGDRLVFLWCTFDPNLKSRPPVDPKICALFIIYKPVCKVQTRKEAGLKFDKSLYFKSLYLCFTTGKTFC